VANQIPVFSNAAYFGDPGERSRAEGWPPPDGSGGKMRNGGLYLERIRGYGDDTMLVRFARMWDPDRNVVIHPAAQLAAGWWLTEDLFVWLLGRVFGATGEAAQNIQSQMLLPPEWNAADCVVRAFPKRGVVLGAWFGRPRSVLAAPGGARRVMQGGGPVQTEEWMYQLYIPGLAKRPHNARNWLEFEGLYSTKPQPGPALSGWPCIRPGTRHR
jgi:hypothetical protein